MKNIQPIRILKVDEVIAIDTSVFNKRNNLEELLESIKTDSYINKYELKEIVILNDKDYQLFISDFFKKHYFLENLYGRYTPDQCDFLCLIVFNIETLHMVGIDTQGYDYARYSGIVQNEDGIRALVKRYLTKVEIKNKDEYTELVDLVTSIFPSIDSDDVNFALNPINPFFLPTIEAIECDRLFRTISPIEYILKNDPNFEKSLNIASIRNPYRNPNLNTISELANYLHIDNLTVPTVEIYHLVSQLVLLIK